MSEKEVQKFENDIGSWDWFADLENRVPAISATDLMEMTVEPREFVVRELLTHGLSILGGAPKCGKSWFVLDLCVHVATGEPFLGFPVTKGTAWYISLEDTKEDLYWRLDTITDEEPKNLFFSTEEDEIGNMEDGMEKHLNNFIDQHPDTKLIDRRCTNMEDKVERFLQQDGKKRDEYFSDLSRKLFESLRDLNNAKERMEQTCRKWVLITAAVSVASSTLACVLCLLLAE